MVNDFPCPCHQNMIPSGSQGFWLFQRVFPEALDTSREEYIVDSVTSRGPIYRGDNILIKWLIK